MRKTLIALLLASALPALAMAAPGDDHRGRDCNKGPHGEHQRGGGKMFDGLNLTPEQREQVGKLMRERKDDPREITRKYLDKLPAADKAAMKKELDTARLDHDKAFNAILTPEQQKVFAEQKQKMEKRRAEREEFEAWKAQRDQKAQ